MRPIQGAEAKRGSMVDPAIEKYLLGLQRAMNVDAFLLEQLRARERERRATERLVARQGEDAKRASLRRRTSVDAGEFQCICYAK